MKKLIIIPAYNEAESIEATVRGIQAKMSGFDYVVINDCSTDKTREICEKNGVCIKRSHGYGTQTEKIEFDDIVKIAEENDISVFEARKMIDK